MAIVWLLIGFVVGLLVAWFFLRARLGQELAKREAELKEENRQTNEDLERLREAHETTKQRLAEVEAKEASAVERGATLEADLDTGREELERVKAADEEKSIKLGQQQSEIDDLKERLSTAENARLQQDEELMRAQAERRAADEGGRSQMADLEARVRERDETIARLEAELATRPATAARPTAAPAAELRTETPAPQGAGPAGGPSDDLTRIKGIGPKLKDKLHGLGIISFRQIADLTPADIARVNEVLDFPGRIEREQWVEQAKTIVDQ